MNKNFISTPTVMVWMTLPLTCSLYIWEHTLVLSVSGHKLVQILVLGIVCTWAYCWNKEAEYHRLRCLAREVNLHSLPAARFTYTTGVDTDQSTAPLAAAAYGELFIAGHADGLLPNTSNQVGNKKAEYNGSHN